MTDCLDPRTLELYVLGAPFGEAVRRDIASHIQGCGFCRSHAEEFAAFYRCAESVDESAEKVLAERVLQRISSRLQPRTRVLRPLSSKPVPERRYLLAAEGEKNPRFHAVQNYVNLEKDCMARLIRDNTTKTLSLYLVSETAECLKDPLIEIDEVEGKFTPDPDGRIALPGLAESDLKRKNLHLHSPLASFDLEPIPDLKEKILVEGRFVLESAGLDRIQIEMDEQGGKTVYRVRILRLQDDPLRRQVHVVVAQRGIPSAHAPAFSGVAVFEELDLERVLNIRIY